MEIAAGLTARMVILFTVAALGQVVGSFLLVRTQGFTQPVWSLACVGVLLASFWAIARMYAEGGAIIFIVPLMAAVVPLLIVFIAVFAMGEPASWARIGLLTAACAVIGYAGRV
jgi:multidrug transporter EmrE-like cation transporter